MVNTYQNDTGEFISEQRGTLHGAGAPAGQPGRHQPGRPTRLLREGGLRGAGEAVRLQRPGKLDCAPQVAALSTVELQVSHQLLGYFHPNGPLDIPDPLHFSDPKGYEKCYWMVYKSMRGLVKFLKEEEEAEARRRPRVVKLPDPTIFTITRYIKLFKILLKILYNLISSLKCMYWQPERLAESEAEVARGRGGAAGGADLQPRHHLHQTRQSLIPSCS